MLDLATIRDSVLDTALNLVQDPIPNIRFNVAKALETIAVTVSTDAEGQELAARKVVPALEKLAGDSDPDVRCASSPVLRSPWLAGHSADPPCRLCACAHSSLCRPRAGEDDRRRAHEW